MHFIPSGGSYHDIRLGDAFAAAVAVAAAAADVAAVVDIVGMNWTK